MGFSGTFLVLRADEPAKTAPLIETLDDPKLYEGPWADGWQIWRVRNSSGGLPEDLLEQLRTATGAPVLAGSVIDSDAVHVTATGVTTPPWQAWLELDKALAYIVHAPSPVFNEYGVPQDYEEDVLLAYEAEVDQARRRILAEAPGGETGARAAIAWAQDAGLVPDTVEAVTSTLGGSAVFAEELFFELLQRLEIWTP